MLQFGKYQLVAPLGKGGMAQVWLAHKSSVAGAIKVCAVKFPRDIFSDDDTEREALFREARVAMLLNHSNIVQVNDLGFVGSLPYVELERIDGIDLSALTEQMRLFGMPFSFSLAAYLLQEILEALAYAHTFSIDGRPHEIVHRDVSPHNVLCSTAGEVKLMDFGIAAAASEHSSGHHARGKLRYMAPEHLAARAVPQSDLFAAGAIFWELLEGKKFRHDTPIEDMRFAVLRHEVPAITRPEVPRELVRLCRDLLEPDLRKRVATADEALKLLRLWPASTSERAGLRALLAQHRVTRRSGMTENAFEMPPWLAAALREINAENGVMIAGRDSDHANASRSTSAATWREADAPIAARRSSGLSNVVPAGASGGEAPAVPHDPTAVLGVPDLRASSTPGARDSVPGFSSSFQVSREASTATATRFVPPPPSRLTVRLSIAAFVLLFGSVAGYAGMTLLAGAGPKAEVVVASPMVESPRTAPKPEPEPEPTGPVLSASTIREPEPPPESTPVIAAPPDPAPPPTLVVEAPTIATNTAVVAPESSVESAVESVDRPRSKPTQARKSTPAPKPKATTNVTVRVRLMLVEYAELKLDKRVIVVAPSADVKIAAGKYDVKWRLHADEPWRSAASIVFGERLTHVVRIGSGGPKHASSPEGAP